MNKEKEIVEIEGSVSELLSGDLFLVTTRQGYELLADLDWPLFSQQRSLAVGDTVIVKWSTGGSRPGRIVRLIAGTGP